jgi:hypothetical protein
MTSAIKAALQGIEIRQQREERERDKAVANQEYGKAAEFDAIAKGLAIAALAIRQNCNIPVPKKTT